MTETINISDDMKAKASLYCKMAKVMGAMNRLPKEGTNQAMNYKFVEAGAVADAVRAALAEHNVAFFAELTGYKEVDGVLTARFNMTFADGDTGATATHTWFGEANSRHKSGARDDKAINRAATAAQKYFLLKTFIISTGDEPDADADAPAQTTRSQRSTPKATTPNEHGGVKVETPLNVKKGRAELTRTFITNSVTITPHGDNGKRLEFTDGEITAYAYTRKHFSDAGFAETELPPAEAGYHMLAHKVEVVAVETVTKDETSKYWRVVGLNIVTEDASANDAGNQKAA